MNRVTIERTRKFSDHRGWLEKVLMRGQLTGNAEFGEIYVTMTVPGQVRAGHYHEQTSEWFYPICGRGTLHLRDLDSGEEQHLLLDGAEPVVIVIPPRVAHHLQNECTVPFHMLAYADRPYNPEEPDTYEATFPAAPKLQH